MPDGICYIRRDGSQGAHQHVNNPLITGDEYDPAREEQTDRLHGGLGLDDEKNIEPSYAYQG